jgi:tetratricopeptide (TPR) repeat protein
LGVTGRKLGRGEEGSSSHGVEDDGEVPPGLRDMIDAVAREQVEAERLRLVALRLLGKEGGIELDEGEEDKKELLDRAEKLFSEKEYSRAMEAYGEIYDRYPEWEYAEHSLMMIGLCHDWLGQLDEEIQVYEKAIREYPDLRGYIDTTHFYLGWACYRKGREEEAIKELEKCVRLGRSSQEFRDFPHQQAERTIALFNAEALFKEGRFEEAIEAYQGISEDYPDWKHGECALFMIGMCHRKMGRREEAIKALELAAEHYPDLRGWTDVTYYHLGRLWEEAGEASKALEAYRNSLRLGEGHRDPGSFPFKDSRQRIQELEAAAEA